MTSIVVLMIVTNLLILLGYVLSTRAQDSRETREGILPPGERKDDPNTWLFRLSLRLHRVNPILVAFTVALTVCCVPVILVLEQQDEIQKQRAESIGLLCDINGILVTFISAPPDLPRDTGALEDLRQERCQALLDDINASR